MKHPHVWRDTQCHLQSRRCRGLFRFGDAQMHRLVQLGDRPPKHADPFEPQKKKKMSIAQRVISSSLLAICFSVGFFLPSFLPSPRSHQASTRSTSIPTSAFPSRQCTPPSIRDRLPALDPACIHFVDIEPTTVRARISKAASTLEVSLSPKTRFAGSPVAIEAINCTSTSACVLTFVADDLLPDTDYLLSVTALARARRTLLCTRTVSTLPSDGNSLHNAGFEQTGDAPFPATRFSRGSESTPRRWTSFYNGGSRVACGAVGDVEPRTGKCLCVLGPLADDAIVEDMSSKYYGVHQSASVRHTPSAAAYAVGAWVRVTPELLTANRTDTSPGDALSMIVSWEWDNGAVDDGVSLPLPRTTATAEKWTLACIVVHIPRDRAFRSLHVFAHRHDASAGALLLDDAFALPLEGNDAGDLTSPSGSIFDPTRCASTRADPPTDGPPGPSAPHATTPHLNATVRPSSNQLTLAVPLTADRAARLSALSRLYGGGPVVAAVAVRSSAEAAQFARLWRGDAWLRSYVSVRFVTPPPDTPLPINALRNAAVSLARTDYVVMLDVDMTPAASSFACFRDPRATYLSTLLPRNTRRLLSLPVFVGEPGNRPPSSKLELLNMLGARHATSYCLDSQRPVRVARWYRENEPYEVRFIAGFEPYAIGRREGYPVFDERFVGYGFNKISWAFGAERDGFALVVLNDAFVTHLNHVENEWVQSIDVGTYLNTWRRYFAFVAEAE